VQRHFPEQIVIGEEVVDADGLEAFERGFGGTELMLALDALQRRDQAFDQLRTRGGLDDRESIAADSVGMGLNLYIRQHCVLPSTISTLCRVFRRQDSAPFRCLGNAFRSRRHCERSEAIHLSPR
jgi:hypothetical protein